MITDAELLRITAFPREEDLRTIWLRAAELSEEDACRLVSATTEGFLQETPPITPEAVRESPAFRAAWHEAQTRAKAYTDLLSQRVWTQGTRIPAPAILPPSRELRELLEKIASEAARKGGGKVLRISEAIRAERSWRGRLATLGRGTPDEIKGIIYKVSQTEMRIATPDGKQRNVPHGTRMHLHAATD